MSNFLETINDGLQTIYSPKSLVNPSKPINPASSQVVLPSQLFKQPNLNGYSSNFYHHSPTGQTVGFGINPNVQDSSGITFTPLKFGDVTPPPIPTANPITKTTVAKNNLIEAVKPVTPQKPITPQKPKTFTQLPAEAAFMANSLSGNNNVTSIRGLSPESSSGNFLSNAMDSTLNWWNQGVSEKIMAADGTLIDNPNLATRSDLMGGMFGVADTLFNAYNAFKGISQTDRKLELAERDTILRERALNNQLERQELIRKQNRGM